METFSQKEGSILLDRIILKIQENKQYLSDIDGVIGDGDHGINMNKGVTLCREALDKEPGGLSHGLKLLGKILMLKIGGSMGPLYGKFFLAFGKSFETKDNINSEDFLGVLDKMSKAALEGRDSTIDMVAKIGRSSRLGERSRGVMDAGSASCYLILDTMATSIKELL
jgi:dihydroxyacetone kinase-like protein